MSQRHLDDQQSEVHGLRGLACLIVLVIHSVGGALPWTDPYIRGTGKIGVWLFFVLSAFLLTSGLVRKHRASNMAQYGLNRVLRILPPLAVAALVYFLMGKGGVTSGDIALGIVTLREGPNHFWTIPVEFKFYVVLPVAVLAMLAAERIVGRYAGLALLVASALAWTYFNPPTDTPDNPLTPRYFAVVFGSGVAAAWLIERYGFKPPTWLPWGALACIALVVVSFKSGLAGDPITGLVDKHYVFGPLWALVLMGTLGSVTVWSTLVAIKPLQVIGQWSFSIYLYHWLVVELLSPLAPWFITIPTTIALSITAGWLGHVAVERPFYALRRLPRSVYDHLRGRVTQTKDVSLPSG